MESLQTIIHIVQPGDWMLFLDRQDAYLRIPILPSFQRREEGRIKIYVSMHSNCATGTLAPQALLAVIPKAVEQTISVSDNTSDKSDSQ